MLAPVTGLGHWGPARGLGFDWGGLVGDLSKQWTAIAGNILTPPAYEGNGVTIRQLPSNGGVPTQGVPVGQGPNTGTYNPAYPVTQVTGISTQTMFGIGMGVLLLVVVMQSQGRR